MKNFCTFYLVRHGLTDWNVERRLQGQVDVPLNEKGIKQAKEAAKRYFKGMSFSAIFSSDLLRAKRTAEIIALEKKMAVKTTELLRERSFGPYEGKSVKEVEKELRIDIKEFRVLSDDQLKKLNIETNTDIMSRFFTFVREVAVAYQGKNVLVVTHGSVMRVFLEKIGYISKEQSKNIVIENLAFIVFLTDGVEFEIKDIKGIRIGDKFILKQSFETQ